MGAEVLIRGKVGPAIVGAFRCSSLYRALSARHAELILWGVLNPPQDGHSYCTVTSELNGVVHELAVIRFTDRLEEQIKGKFSEKVWAAVDADCG